MNCTICNKSVDEHGEGRETDRCVAEKLGWVVDEHEKEYPEIAYGRPVPNSLVRCVPFYSSPTMSADVWGLTEKIFDFDLKRHNSKWQLVWGEWKMTNAPTITLAICRAFLAMKGEDNE